ncbi:MAG TPA: hypothetical protein ENN09_04725 [Planctomycetes bacterium]|nr:hypothetical protein [Planctomycetota bacterium]
MAKVSSRRAATVQRPVSYGSTDHSKSISMGFKVLGVLVLFGLVSCLWFIKPRPPTRDKAMKDATERLIRAVHDALKEMTPPPADETAAFEALARAARCKQCEGSGRVAGDDGEDVDCPLCGGVGISVKMGMPALRFRQAILEPAACDLCKGRGEINYAVCKRCLGKGYFRKNAPEGVAGTVEAILRDLDGGIIRDAYGGKIKISAEIIGKSALFTVTSAGKDKRFGTRDDLKYSGAAPGAP